MTLAVSATADATGAASSTLTQSIIVNVTGITQGATIDAPQAVGGIANQPTPFVVNVSDGHLGEAVTAVTITGAPTGTTLSVDGQTIAANADGSFTLTPDQASNAGLAITPPHDFIGALNLTVNATADASGATALTTSQVVTLNISAGATIGATIAAPVTVADTENQAVSFSLNVADGHVGESVLGVSITGAPAGSLLSVGGVTIVADSHGTFNLTAAQASHSSLSITPPADYSGTMSLQVNATAEALPGGSPITTTQNISLNVGAVTQGATLSAPGAVAGAENVSAPLTLVVSDGHTGEAVTGVAISGAPTGSTLIVGGQTITADSQGVFHLTATQANDSSLVVQAPTDFSGSMILQVDVTAANGSAAPVTTSQNVTVELSAVTQGASVTAPSSVAVNENNAVAFHINVADAHTGESISDVAISGAPAGSTLTIGGQTMLPGSDGSFHLSPAQAASANLSINPPQDYFGAINLQVDATAANGSAAAVTTSQLIQVNVIQTTQGAAITAPTTLSDTENHSASFTLNVSDIHTGEGVTAVTITGAPRGSVLSVGGSVIAQNSDGSFTLTPDQASNSSLSISPPTDYSGTITLHVNATADVYSDTSGVSAATASQTITMNVTGVTQGATITEPAAVGDIKGYTASFSLNVADTHGGEAVSAVTLTGAPSGTLLSVGGHAITQNTDNSFTLTPAQAANATLSITPPATYSGTMSLHVNATAHEAGATDVVSSQAFNLVVKAAAAHVTTAGPGTLQDTENHSVSFVTNTQETGATYSVSTVQIYGAPAGTQINIDGTIINVTSTSTKYTIPSSSWSNGNVTITPPADYTGTMKMSIKATDSHGYTNTAAFSVVVSPAAQGASISVPTSVNDTVNHAAPITLQVTDSHSGESISSVSISGAPTGSTLSVGGVILTPDSHGTFTLTLAQAVNASLSLTPPANFTGLISLGVNATATTTTGVNLNSSDVIAVHVANVTQGASITVPAATVLDTENHSATFAVNVSDSHVGETLTGITLSGAPHGTTLTIDGDVIHANSQGVFTLTSAQAASANVTITPPTDYSGTMTLSLNATATATGASSLTTSQTFTVSVGALTQGASIQLPDAVTGKEDHVIKFHMDVDDNHTGEAVTAVTLTGAPLGASLTAGGTVIHQNMDGSFTLTGAQADDATLSITPPNGYVGSMDLYVNATAQNGTAAAVTTSDHIIVNVANVGPSGDHNQSYRVNIGSSVSDNVGASAPVGDVLTYSLSANEMPSHGIVSMDQSGNFTYTAQAGYVGTDQFQIVVSDGQGGTFVQTETVRVSNPFHSGSSDGFEHEGGSHGDASAIYGGGGDAHITVGNSNITIFGNDGTATTGSGICISQLHINAVSADEAFGATMSYSLGNVPDHASIVDIHGNILDASHLTDAQIQSGVFLSFPDNHVAASFDLSVTANLTEPNGTVSQSATSVHVDTSFMGGNDTITAGDGNDTIYGGAGNNVITVGDGNDSIVVYDGNNVISVGSGTNTITVGSGNNTISVDGGSDTINADSGGSLTVEHMDAMANANITIHNTGVGSSDLVFDFSATHDTVTGGTGTSWTDTIDLTQHTGALTITATDASGQVHTWTEAATAHGTVDFTQANGLNQHDVAGTATMTDSHGIQHIIDFHNIELVKF